ncbi:MAG: hypothetical protein MUO58_20285 [Anaerolineales bacterium]|nr:hypothetical protein [Anaerolineales bacterium]
MKFKNKYRIESARLRPWDYSSPGWYFVTVCTKNKENFFGDVICGEMCLSETGRIVSEEWSKNEIIRSNIALDDWIIMPNHIHGILVIVERAANVETPCQGVSTISKWKPGTLGAIINQSLRNVSDVQELLRSPGSLVFMITASGMMIPYLEYGNTLETIQKNGRLIAISTVLPLITRNNIEHDVYVSHQKKHATAYSWMSLLNV